MSSDGMSTTASFPWSTGEAEFQSDIFMDKTSIPNMEELSHSLTNAEHYTVGFFYLLAGLLGLGGQSLLIWGLLTKSPTSHSHRFTVHVSMAVANAGVVIGFPLTATSSFATRWLFGHFGCQFYGFIGMMFGLASIHHLIFVAFDLYRHRLTNESITQNTSIQYKQSAVAWVAAAIWSSLPLFGWASYGEEPSKHSCTLNWQENDAHYISYVMVVTVCCYTIPFIMMTFCVMATLHTNKQCAHDTPHFDSQLLKLTVCLMLVYLVMWSPYALLCLYAVFSDPSHVSPLLACVPSLVAKLGSCLTPIVYFKLLNTSSGTTVNISQTQSTSQTLHLRSQ